ncbi:putative HTH-type transcriptional regulator YulB [Paenibacillus baekrokdamisoli]|uniref:Putative HTH-type transcriptional regulator YulB n=1 Tax=Paenibacillus baekrokdamisoli TaxID=1712516 RepID=A0A3G9IZ74_9BACL|nr:DeoR/GlpR family DNA-binding transcription regulator [Paenibacillus baekrokdamisoli]MBB3072636.1 DeoR/GlpR family transcriptional regulator of sugar metabolism [Paenibacillus baekrokdamisoli]BBH18921.1 putative HTH-type transcriptional regulator YulB [Paenibacillus baekrokdamisoli]
MLVAERYEKIVQQVNERGSIRVSELSELCQVTEETIRRDLDRLEQAGRLRRSHGGAVSVKDQQQQPETPYTEREIIHAEEKKRIAEEAIKWIQPKDRILLDASTTAWYMASMLPDFQLTVLTNSIRVATELSSREKVEVISTGGLLAQRSLSFVGPLAERSLDAYHVDKLFFSCKGVHLERGISESNELQSRIKQKMAGIADQVILLADSSKFGIQAFTHVVDLQQVDAIITDRRIAPDVLNQLTERNIPITTV